MRWRKRSRRRRMRWRRRRRMRDSMIDEALASLYALCCSWLPRKLLNKSCVRDTASKTDYLVSCGCSPEVAGWIC
eukprot:6908193-Pyramimonas_sp.AAC.1